MIIGKYQTVLDEKGKEKNVDLSINPKKELRQLLINPMLTVPTTKWFTRCAFEKKKYPN